MSAVRGWSFRGRFWLASMCLIVASGCALTQARLEKALLDDRSPEAHTRDLEARYLLRCPDVVEIHIDGHDEISGVRPVAADGRVRLGQGTTVRVAGHTAPEVRRALAEHFHLAEPAVKVRVAEHKSQSIYLFSDVEGAQKVVAYRGPETILELLQRLGGVSPGSAPGNIQVVRSHIADGKPPEVFHVDLTAILLRHDQHTNVRLEPFDRVYIGQNRRSRIAVCVPPVLLPVYRLLCGISG
jgi:protein involved in polysaccharide export with SLBB domain